MWLLYVSCVWVGRIFLGSKLSLPVLALSFVLIPFALMPFFPRSKKTLIVVGLCLFALLGGGLYFPSSLPSVDEYSLHFYNDTGIVDIQGMVAVVALLQHVSDGKKRYLVQDQNGDCGDTITQNFCRSACVFNVARSQYSIPSLCNEAKKQAFLQF